MTPNGPHNVPSSRVSIPGMIVWYGRLPGAYTLGRPGSSTKPHPRFWSVNPSPGGTMPVPKLANVELTTEHALPCASTAQ